MKNHAGFTLIEVLIGLGILGIVSSSIYAAYGSVLEIVQSSQYNSAALNIIESHIETVRNMRYEDVGTVGGVPNGKIPQIQAVALDTAQFNLHTYVRNIDDPFDGTLGGSPNDTSPADYKFVEFQVTCDTCTRYKVITLSTYVAPKNLESSSKRGNLFIKVFDANGAPVVGATVTVSNTTVTPPINLTDVTNNQGMLQLVDTATSSAGYHIVVSKSGYTTDQTHPPGNPANPVKPDATVASQQLTITSLTIDRVSTLAFRGRDQFCQAMPNVHFLLTGSKLIGTSPDTPKYSITQTTNIDGQVNPAIEWDTYRITPTDTVFDIAGKAASLSFTINPNASHPMTWLIASRSGTSLLTAIVDADGQPIDGATITLTKTGLTSTAITGQSTFTQTDWSGGKYDSKSANMDTDTAPGILTLAQVGGKYATGSEEWLISKTYNMGSASASFIDVNYNPTSQPPQTTARIQVAANNDNTTWNWMDLSGSSIPSALNGNQYFRYKVLLQSTNSTLTPSLTDTTIGFDSGCLVSGQAYLTGLTAGTYTLTVTKSGFQPYSAPIILSSGWQEVVITLTP